MISDWLISDWLLKDSLGAGDISISSCLFFDPAAGAAEAADAGSILIGRGQGKISIRKWPAKKEKDEGNKERDKWKCVGDVVRLFQRNQFRCLLTLCIKHCPALYNYLLISLPRGYRFLSFGRKEDSTIRRRFQLPLYFHFSKWLLIEMSVNRSFSTAN